MTHEKQQSILRFWFGEDTLKPLANKDMWFSKKDSIDDAIRARFEDLLTEAGTGSFDDWVKTADGALALVILLDQFPRNIYRDDEKAFAFDDHARKIAETAIDHRLDRAMTPIERCFLYLPLEHTENVDVQERSVELFTQLMSEAHDEEKALISEAVNYALRHRDIIARFGRFPHRNDIVGRESNRQEKEFLKTPNSGF